MIMSDTCIKFENVSKVYRRGVIGAGTLRGDLQSLFAKMRGKPDPNQEIGNKTTKNGKFYALRNISFEVGRGETLGIIGKNGAGKSTLLKLLSNVTAPTNGEIKYNGKISSLLEIGTGFHPELTGRENVYLNGAILGMTKREIAAKMNDIIEYSGIGEFIDTPAKRYSSGMYVKLAFAVAANLNSDILIMDEVLSVGDGLFRKKSIDTLLSAANDEGRTVLCVSHNMNTIRKLCSRCIVLDEGQIIFDGETDKAINIYNANVLGSHELEHNFEGYVRMRGLTAEAVLQKTRLQILGENKFSLTLNINAKRQLDGLYVGFSIFSVDGNNLGTTSTADKINFSQGENVVNVKMNLDCLTNGEYYLRFMLYSLNKTGGITYVDVVPEMQWINVYRDKALAKAFGNVLFDNLQLIDSD